MTIRLLSLLMILTLFLPAQSRAEEAFTPAQKEALGPLVRDYLIRNPEVIMEALESLQRQKEKSQQEDFSQKFSGLKSEIYSGKAPIAGNPEAKLTIIEFFDYNCGYCKKAVDDVIGVVGSDKDVKFILLDLPILSASSEEASRWALAAALQGKYYEYHVALMKFQGSKNKDVLEKIAKDLDLDVAKLRKDAEGNKAIREQIETNRRFAQELGISGTPAFIIGDMLVPGYMGLEGMKDAITAVRSGTP